MLTALVPRAESFGDLSAPGALGRPTTSRLTPGGPGPWRSNLEARHADTERTQACFARDWRSRDAGRRGLRWHRRPALGHGWIGRDWRRRGGRGRRWRVGGRGRRPVVRRREP